jgi:hypothetical protein
MMAGVLWAAGAFAETCTAITQEGARCSRKAKGLSDYCSQHAQIVAARDQAAAAPEDDFPEINMQLITESRRVLAVTNGVYLVLDGAQKARLAGVIANNGANGFVRAFCGTNTVVVEYDRVETGHQYATVFIRNGTDCLNEELLRAGLGGLDIHTMFRYWGLFTKAQGEARLAKRGVWADAKLD